MAKKKPEVWIDKDGYEVPVEHIDPLKVERSRMISNLYRDAVMLSMTMKNFKQQVREQIKRYLNDTADKYGEKWQGNTKLLNFSQDLAIDISVNKYMQFDERLNLAKAKIDKCIQRWAKDSNLNVVTLINSAFKVDKKGNLDTKLILGLRQHKFDDKDWIEAMDLIADSLTIQSTKQYMHFQKKDNEGNWQTVILNWSQM